MNISNYILDENNQSDHFEETRETNSKLSFTAINEIIKDLKDNKISKKEIAKKFECSVSNIYRIKSNIDYYSKHRRQNNSIWIDKLEKKSLIKTINSFESKCLTPFTINDIQRELNRKTGVIYPKHALNKIMKKDCNMSYKRVNSRPKQFDFESLSAARTLYWTQFLWDLSQDTLMINIDETIFNRNWKINYSWSLRGLAKEWQNEFVLNSMNMIFGLCSNGSWIALLINEAINSN